MTKPVLTYTNRRGQVYYLHAGKTKTDKQRYFVAKTHPIRTVRKLLSVGERLPDKIRREIRALGDAAVSPLLEILADDELAMSRARGGGYAPVHAAWLLSELRAEAAIGPMLAVLAETECGTILHDAIVMALEPMGAAVLEPALRAYAEHDLDDFRESVASLLAAIDIHDERILAILREQLALAPELAAGDLARYRDPRALDDLVRAFDAYHIFDTDHPFAHQALTEILSAIEDLGGKITAAQARKYERAMEPYERWRRHRAAEGTTSRSKSTRTEAPGRDEPCWCGSAKKYKKCHLDADDAESRGEGIQP
jgi:hypothetical protein